MIFHLGKIYFFITLNVKIQIKFSFSGRIRSGYRELWQNSNNDVKKMWHKSKFGSIAWSCGIFFYFFFRRCYVGIFDIIIQYFLYFIQKSPCYFKSKETFNIILDLFSNEFYGQFEEKIFIGYTFCWTSNIFVSKMFELAEKCSVLLQTCLLNFSSLAATTLQVLI